MAFLIISLRSYLCRLFHHQISLFKISKIIFCYNTIQDFRKIEFLWLTNDIARAIIKKIKQSFEVTYEFSR